MSTQTDPNEGFRHSNISLRSGRIRFYLFHRKGTKALRFTMRNVVSIGVHEFVTKLCVSLRPGDFAVKNLHS